MIILSLKEAGAKLRLTERSIRRMIETGIGPPVVKISARRLGIIESDLDDWAKTRRVMPPGWPPVTTPDAVSATTAGPSEPLAYTTITRRKLPGPSPDLGLHIIPG